MSEPQRRLIDVHHHVIPPFYGQSFGERLRGRNAANVDQVLRWTPAGAVEAKDKNGIAVSLLSISSAEFWFDDDALARRLCRETNEYCATMMRDYPGRFGFFAALPMPDVDATLEEIWYAYDVLHADGVGLMSNYGHIWPGDSKFIPVFDELNQRKARVFTHPILPIACKGMIPGVGESALEYLFDTARAIASHLYNGSFLRWPDIKFIYPHAGGAMPPLADRVARMADRDRKVTPKPEQGSINEVRNLFFDVTASTNPVTLTGLLKLVPASQVMFGSDYPFLNSMPYTIDPLGRAGLSEADLLAIEQGTAISLFPRLAGLVDKSKNA